MRRFLPYVKYLKPIRATFGWALFWGLLFGISSGFSIPVMLQKVFGSLLTNREADLSTWQLIGYTSLLPAAFLIRGISGYLNTYYVNLCGARVLEGIRTDFFAKLQALPLAFFQKHRTGDLVSRGMADTNQLQTVLTLTANEAVKQPATLLAALSALVYLSLKHENFAFLLLCLAVVPVIILPIRFVGRKMRRRARQMQNEMGDVTSLFSDNLGALREIRAFNLQAPETRRFADRIRDLLNIQMKVVKYQHILSPVIEFVAAIGIALAFFYSYRAGLTADVFLALAAALYFSYEPVKKIGILNTHLRRGQGSLERLEEILQAPVSIADPTHPTPLHLPVRGDLAFQNVSFAYGEAPVLSNVSVNIPAGTVCALVGPSGAGKSTFVNLVPRFYDAGSGSVTLDGHDVRSLRLTDLRDHIALVSQDPVLFNDTILANLRIGRPSATVQEIEQAARDASAHDFILSLPEGYATLVGERGASLSGGQRQRIALARAFLRNAPILILDEATSALDSESEAMVQQALTALVRGRTTFIIAHRFSTITIADRVVVFDLGRIVADGSHDELRATSPIYQSMLGMLPGPPHA